jgi:cytochrome b
LATENLRPGATAVRIWDLPTRLFHWSLAVCVGGSIISIKAGSIDWHMRFGYGVLALVLFRLLWGFAGSRYARFAQFLKGPGATLSYLGDMAHGKERRYLGHNPAGAAMIVALLVTLSGTAFTGWLMEEPGRVAMLPDLPSIVAPAWADDDGDDHAYGEGGEAEGPLKELHETLANLLLLLAALHVGGVVLASFRHRENLARAMVTGDKRAPGPGDIA